MKERLYLTPDARAWLEVCDCQGELQIRMRGLERVSYGLTSGDGQVTTVRVPLNAKQLARIAEFIQGVAEELEIVERERNT
jgi:hypothetical protein